MESFGKGGGGGTSGVSLGFENCASLPPPPGSPTHAQLPDAHRDTLCPKPTTVLLGWSYVRAFDVTAKDLFLSPTESPLVLVDDEDVVVRRGANFACSPLFDPYPLAHAVLSCIYLT